MYRPNPDVKNDPKRRWQQPDRIFFGFGACQILAGVFLCETQLTGWYGEWIKPEAGFGGHHIYATNGTFTFDFHGFVRRENLLAHHWKGYQKRNDGWSAAVAKIDFSLLDTTELNKRNHRGPDQYFADPIPRAKRFIASKQLAAGRCVPS